MLSTLNAWLLIAYISSSSTSITMQRFNTEDDCKMIAQKITKEIKSAVITTECVELIK
jgi:hypothetical protein